MRTVRLQGETRQNLFDDHIKLFLHDLQSAGYAERTLRKKRPILRSFARWAKRREIGVLDFNDRHVVAFVAGSARRRKAFVALQLSVMRRFLRYLRCGAGAQRPPVLEDTSAADDLLRHYEDFLRRNRGLAENSIHVYIPFIRSFLTSHATRRSRVPQRLFNTLAIRNFILGHIHNRSGEYVRLLATALRSFFRFLFLSGRIPRDLSPFDSQSLQVPSCNSARFSRAGGSRACIGDDGPINTHWSAGLRNPDSACPARPSRRRNRRT
jgi:integrase/recombinase XerD